MSIFSKKYQIENDIYIFETNDIVLQKVEKFYDRAPFPSYEANETKFDILKKGNSNTLANQFKKFCGFNKLILEAGAGTCQLSNYLSIGTNNKIYALDGTKSSLEEGLKFKKKNIINNLYLVKGDILENNFEKNTFDLIWCSGVLHHTKDPYLGFVNLCNYLKDDGYILIGLYNRYGRLRTLIRKYLSKLIISKLLKEKFLNFFDPVLRNLNKDRSKNLEKIDAWMQDQYLHPVESLHTIDEVLNWFKLNNIEYISSIPSCEPSINTSNKNLFAKEEKGNFITRILVQLGMLFGKMGSEGGLFIVIGKKNDNHK